MKKVTAIVAGGAGFIGSHLCRRLLELGRRVIAVDNLSTGSIDNLNQIYGNPDFELVVHDIVNPIDIKVPAQEIYNMACPASPRKYQSNPVGTFRTSTIGSYNLLELARRHDSRILLASTSEVYGDSSKSPQTEDYFGNVNTVGIRSCYDEGKRGAETLFKELAHKLKDKKLMTRLRTDSWRNRYEFCFDTYLPDLERFFGQVISFSNHVKQ